jgi:hypothetical protein
MLNLHEMSQRRVVKVFKKYRGVPPPIVTKMTRGAPSDINTVGNTVGCSQDHTPGGVCKR